MKAYGIPRVIMTECPDVQDIRRFGMKYSAGGRDYFRNKQVKSAIRRYYKKRHRANVRNELRVGTHAGNCTAL